MTIRYPRVLVEFRAISRVTTDVTRPMLLAIRAADHPAFNPVEISARSAAVNNRRVPATNTLQRQTPTNRSVA